MLRAGKTIRKICLLLCLLLLLFGCGAEQSGDNALAAAENTGYESRHAELPFTASGIRQALLAKGKIYILAEKRQEKGNYFETETVIYIAGTDGRVLSPANGVPCGQSATPEKEGMIALSLFADENGEANLLYQRFAYGSGPAKLSYAKIGDNGELSDEHRFDVTLTVGSNLRFAQVGGDGRIYAQTEDNFSIYERNGKCDFSEDGMFAQGVFPMGEKTAVISRTDSGNTVLSTVKKNGKSLVGETAVDGAQNMFAAGGRYDIVGVSSRALFAYDAESGESAKLLDWIDADVNFDRLCAVLMTEDGGAFCIEIDDGTSTISVDVLTPTEKDELPEKTVLKLGIPEGERVDNTAILDFNRNSGEYRIEPVYYSDEKELALAVITGNAPDIYQLNGDFSVRALAEKGAFCDLVPFMERDFGEGVLNEHVKNLLSFDGRIYEAYSEFVLSTVIGFEKNVGSEKDWSFQKLCESYAKLPEGAALIEGYSEPEEILEVLLRGAIYDFVDFEHAVCSFDSDEFIAVLDFAMSTGAAGQESGEAADFEHGSALLSTAALYEPGLYALYRSHISDEEISFVGYPSAGGGRHFINFGNGYAISESCKNKEEAWKFVKNFLTEEYQNALMGGMGYPTNAAVFERYLTAQKEQGVGKPYHYGSGVSFDAVTEQEQRELRALIESAVIDRREDYAEIFSIIKEESAHFFAGKKSAADCAGIIQSRAKVYLSERYE